jgi:hypothetical protein
MQYNSVNFQTSYNHTLFQVQCKDNREFKFRVFRVRQTADSNFLLFNISVKRFRFIFSFLCRKNSHALQF